MSLFNFLFGGLARTMATEPGEVVPIMGVLNRNALIGVDNGEVAIIEDVTDPDGRMYRMEYRSTPDGRHATAFCRFNPWGDTPDAGEDPISSHVFSDGSICMGEHHFGGNLHSSPYDLETVVTRARFWCTGFSVLKETGRFPNP